MTGATPAQDFMADIAGFIDDVLAQGRKQTRPIGAARPIPTARPTAVKENAGGPGTRQQ